MAKTNYKSIDEYIGTYPKDVQVILNKVRATINKAAPDAKEAISYQMPTFKLNGKNLVHFAAWKNHIGFYAMPSGNVTFKKELSKYQQEIGSVRFPLDDPLPLSLIQKIVKFRVKEDKEKGDKNNVPKH